jgi:protein transport protein SEC24
MVRPPVPPVYFFVIDVTANAGGTSMLQSCVNAIKASLDQLPGAPRTQVGFITYDSSIHFYNLKSTLTAPQMLVVSDVSDVIMPLPDDLLVSLNDSRAVIDSLLDSIPAMFAQNSSMSNCMGPALQAAKRIVTQVGGKICLFQTGLPNLGEGALKQRDNPRLLGTDKEHTLLNADDQWYKTNAVDFNRLQVCIELFLFSAQYTDVATLSLLSKLTGGGTYYYPGFNADRDGAKFESELKHTLTRSTAFEAVMRIRATRGLKVQNFYGNYYIRGTDLLSLPNCTSDSTFGFDLSYEDQTLPSTAVTVQAALLYTSSNGERRIRVHTTVIPVCQSIPDFLDSIDIDCGINLLCKQSADIALKTGLENARSRVHQLSVDIMRAAKGGPSGGMPGQYGNQFGQQQQQQQQQPLPLSLQLLPLYAMSLQKSLCLRGGSDVRADERSFYMQLVGNMSIDESRIFIYPRMFSIHDMPADTGIPSDSAEDTLVAGPERIRLPAILNLSHERLASEGVFLLETGHDLFLWIGRAVSPAILHTLLNVQSLEGVDMSLLQLQPDNSDFSCRVSAVVGALRADRSRHMQLHMIREGDGYAEAFFARYLMEDRANFNGGTFSYQEYHAYVTRQVSGMP